ncbi:MULTISPECIES: choice-of-anchor B family protein [unclassified Streptomyces]|uniref:choice-of-anchor B family protein n=1 Tax=unclassified Streptomyces TaxID=2593676 RepID=UPI0022B69F10|nr:MULTISPECIES: choice-of-anchor B family protein [unclassified Streptomyces]MCZ7413964.1 choice-of-anchor B family protein [Streptomyces sp. WMMC897]MCZ7430960.1 choice-of-anchor B family protein [Streptomyces sp. WMMC1477]
MKRLPVVLMAVLAALLLGTLPATAHPGHPGEGKDAPAEETDPDFPTSSDNPATSRQPCVDGQAGYFPCDNVNLMAYLPMDEIGGGRGSDVWGWTDPVTERRYVLAGRDSGTAFVDVTNATKPVFLADLPNSGERDVIWRDIKVHDDHAFIVSEARQHGMQVLDLTRLRDIDPADAPVTLTETALYRGIGSAHNIAINEDSGYAYLVGARDDVEECAGGLHMVDIRQPASPAFAGCAAEDGYTHDTQCVTYDGPDARFTGREICLSSNEDTFTIMDVTDKSDPVMLSRIGYDGAAYTHQGWLTEDSRHFLMGDELDEYFDGDNTRTLIWDVSDLTAPKLLGKHTHRTAAIDHNMYVRDGLVFQSNYRAGLSILSTEGAGSGELTEIAYFDTWPMDDRTAFGHGTWSNYPFFDNGVVAVHGFDGLFLLRPTVGLG